MTEKCQARVGKSVRQHVSARAREKQRRYTADGNGRMMGHVIMPLLLLQYIRGHAVREDARANVMARYARGYVAVRHDESYEIRCAREKRQERIAVQQYGMRGMRSQQAVRRSVAYGMNTC